MKISTLTKAEKHEVRQNIDAILLAIAPAGILKKVKPWTDNDRFYRRLETFFSISLRTYWKNAYTEAIGDIFARLPDSITQDAIQIIEDGLMNALGDSFALSQEVRQEVRKKIETAYAKSKNEWGKSKPNKTVLSSLKLQDHRAIDIMQRHNCFWLGKHYGEHVGPKISDIARKALEDGLGRKELAGKMKEAFEITDYKYWDVVSSSALVRARSFGAISGMEEAGITDYELMAMGDERMCPICGEMDGRVFSVASAKESIEGALSLSSPDDFKSAMPWHTKPPIGIAGSDLARSGMTIPPLHGRCRCIIVESLRSESVTVSSFTTLRSGAISGFDEDTRIAKIKDAQNLPPRGLPGWKYDRIDNNGDFLDRRVYGSDGKAVLDIHGGDHGKPKTHFYGAHAHDWLDEGHPDKPRRLKKWEAEIMQLNKTLQVKKHKIKKNLLKKKDSSYYQNTSELIGDIERGFEVAFNWKNHRYLVWKHGDEFRIGEAYTEDDIDQVYESLQELMDNAVLVTGEKFLDVAMQVEIECVS